MTLPVLLFYGFAFIGILHSIIFSFFAIKTKRTADLMIAFYLLSQSLIILEYVFYWAGMNVHYHYFNGISLPLLFLFGPLLFIYIEYVFNENRNLKQYFFHFIPAFVVFILMLPFFFSTGELKNFHYKMIKYFIIDFKVLTYIIMSHLTIYFIVILSKIVRQKRVGYINLWLQTIIFFFAFYIVCYMSYYYMVTKPWFTLTHDYFVSFGMCGSIVAIIYLAYGKNKILNGYEIMESVALKNLILSYKESPPKETVSQKKNTVLAVDIQVPFNEAISDIKSEMRFEPELMILFSEKYKNSGLTDDLIKELALSLKQLMQKEQLYKESELRLETLSEKLGVSKHYVSQVINQFYGVNFFEYINVLRIEEAKQLLSSNDKKSMNIIEVAYAVGYSTKNTFNKSFRRIVGITPTEFRRLQQVQLN